MNETAKIIRKVANKIEDLFIAIFAVLVAIIYIVGIMLRVVIGALITISPLLLLWALIKVFGV